MIHPQHLRIVFLVLPGMIWLGGLSYDVRRAVCLADERPATAFGRAGSPRDKPVSAERLVRLFRTNREEAKFKALDEAQASVRDSAGAADALWQAIEAARQAKRFGPALLAAVRLYADAPDPSRIDRLSSLLEASDPQLTLEAADALARLHAAEALPAIMRLDKRVEFREQYGYRHAVLSAVAKFPEPAAVDWLLDTLERFDGQLRYEAARGLAVLTGENLGGNASEWRAWWSARRGASDVLRAASVVGAANAGPVDVPWNRPVPQFFGTPIYALRVVFVIDRSRSMLSSVDDVTRLDEAQHELEQAIRELPPHAEFDVVAYDSNVRLWRDFLVPATSQNKSDAVRFTYSLFPDNKTACYDALSTALSLDPNLETVVFLTDGEPTAGRIVDPAQIVQTITARNARQRTAINVLSIDALGPAEGFLKALAGQNFGQYHAVR